MDQANHVYNGFKELMSRGNPGHSTNPAKAAHAQCIAAFAANPSRPISLEASCIDLEIRSEHADRALATFQAYLTALMADCAHHGVRFDRSGIDALYSDFRAEIVGAISAAADDAREAEYGRAL